MTLNIGKPWWEKDTYDDETTIPEDLHRLAGPEGIAAVKVWPNGTTSTGWGVSGKDGKPAFMPKYNKGEFLVKRVLHGYDRDSWALAFVMRSMNVVVVDIDGKNDGFEHAEAFLLAAPYTLAETSKSGNGLHLYFEVDDTWDNELGYGEYLDHIGIVQGVDIRGVGCVYHHKQQRWNGRPIAKLPPFLQKQLRQKAIMRRVTVTNIKKVLDMEDPEEVVIMQDNIMDELKKPIAEGKRNNTLFAIGSKMKLAEIPDWETKLGDRAEEVGLPADEVAKLIRNVDLYAV